MPEVWDVARCLGKPVAQEAMMEYQTTALVGVDDISMHNTASIAVRRDGCFQLIPVHGGTRPRKYHKPSHIGEDYRKLVKEYGSNNVKVFQEIEIVLRDVY